MEHNLDIVSVDPPGPQQLMHSRPQGADRSSSLWFRGVPWHLADGSWEQCGCHDGLFSLILFIIFFKPNSQNYVCACTSMYLCMHA